MNNVHFRTFLLSCQIPFKTIPHKGYRHILNGYLVSNVSRLGRTPPKFKLFCQYKNFAKALLVTKNFSTPSKIFFCSKISQFFPKRKSSRLHPYPQHYRTKSPSRLSRVNTRPPPNNTKHVRQQSCRPPKCCWWRSPLTTVREISFGLAVDMGAIYVHPRPPMA